MRPCDFTLLQQTLSLDEVLVGSRKYLQINVVVVGTVGYGVMLKLFTYAALCKSLEPISFLYILLAKLELGIVTF